MRVRNTKVFYPKKTALARSKQYVPASSRCFVKPEGTIPMTAADWRKLSAMLENKPGPNAALLDATLCISKVIS